MLKAGRRCSLMGVCTHGTGPSGCSCPPRQARMLCCSQQASNHRLLTLACRCDPNAPAMPVFRSCKSPVSCFWQRQACCSLLQDGELESRHIVCAERFRGAKLSHKDTFYSSLICNVEPGCRLLRCFEDAEGAAFSWAGWATTLLTPSPPCEQ